MMAHYAARLRTVSSAELCRAAPSPIQNNNKLFTFRSILCFEIGNISFIELNIINPST